MFARFMKKKNAQLHSLVVEYEARFQLPILQELGTTLQYPQFAFTAEAASAPEDTVGVAMT